MPFFGCCYHREQVAPNPGHHHNVDPNNDLVAVIVGDKTFQHAFRRTVQHSSPGSENIVGCSEMHVVIQMVLKVADDGVVEVVTGCSAIHHKDGEVTVEAVLGCNGGRRRSHESLSTVSSPFPIPNMWQRFDVFSATGTLKEMAGSARQVNGQGRVLHPSVAAVGAGPKDRASFSFSTRALADLVADWISLAENEMQRFSSESSRTGDPMKCRSKEHSEEGLKQSGRCC